MAGSNKLTTYHIAPGQTVPVIMIVFFSIAFYNVLELLILTLGTFKRYRGLYFWSVLIATLGVAFNASGHLIKHLSITHIKHLYTTITTIGWCTMITGQSVVLYSRLHLVVQNQKILRAVLIMIIADAIWLHIPIIVIIYGANSSKPTTYLAIYSVYEKIQLCTFFLQETIISGLYIWHTAKLLKSQRGVFDSPERDRRSRKVMMHLIVVNIIVILLDVIIIAFEFAHEYQFQVSWKPLAYSIKLKLEYSVLNKLVNLMKGGSSDTREYAANTSSISNHASPRGGPVSPVSPLSPALELGEKKKPQVSQNKTHGYDDFGYSYSYSIGVEGGRQTHGPNVSRAI